MPEHRPFSFRSPLQAEVYATFFLFSDLSKRLFFGLEILLQKTEDFTPVFPFFLSGTKSERPFLSLGETVANASALLPLQIHPSRAR